LQYRKAYIIILKKERQKMASIAVKVLDLEDNAVEFTFTGQEPILVKASDFSADVQAHFMLHGMSQKLGDSYSSAKGDVAVAMESFKSCLEQLKNGDWRAARGEGEAKPRTTELASAVARIKGVEVSVAAQAISAMPEEQRKALRSNDRVKATIALLRAEKAQAKLDKMEDDDIGI
jgi:hypothetical protein